MKKILITPLLLLTFLLCKTQEYPLQNALSLDMLELNWKCHAVHINEKLWQIDVDVDVQEGITDGRRKYYIELQDTTVLDLKVEKQFLWWHWYGRYFPRQLKHKLIKFEIITDEPINDSDL